MPFGKESPFSQPVMRAINKMREKGILDDIKKKYRMPQKIECGDDSKVLYFYSFQCVKKKYQVIGFES